MSRVIYNLLLALALCTGFHAGMNAHAVDGILHALIHNGAYQGDIVFCLVMNQIGLWQPQPHKEEPLS